RLVVLRLRQAQATFAAREEGRGHLGEVRLHRVERLREAALDRLRQFRAELLELVEALLEICALRRELLEPRLLRVVLLLRERIDLAEALAAALEALGALVQLFAVVAFRALLGARVGEPPTSLVGLGLDARSLDVDRGRAVGRVGERLPQLDLGRTESAQFLAQLAGACGPSVDACPQRRFEARRGNLERTHEPLRERGLARDDRVCLHRVRRSRNWGLRPAAELVELGRERPSPSLQLEQDGLGSLAREPQLAAFRV